MGDHASSQLDNEAVSSWSDSNETQLLTGEYLPYVHFNRQQGPHEYKKNLGIIESYVYVFSQNFGFAIVALPFVFQQSGLLLTIFALAFFSIISNWTPLLLIETQALIPGNKNFEQNVEYLGIARYYFKECIYYLFHLVLNIYYTILNILNIRISCNALDSFFILCFGHTYGVVFYSSFGLVKTADADYFYSDHIVIGITISYVILTAIIVTLSFCDLKDNIRVQFCCVLVNFFCMGVFIWHFFHLGFQWHRVPIAPKNISYLIGSMIFAMGYAGIIPAWTNRAESSTSYGKILIRSAIFVSFLNVLLPLMAAYSFEHVHSEDFLQQLALSDFKITKIAVYMYTLTIITSNIPFLSIIVKKNLYNTDFTGRKTAQFISIGIPWIIGFLFNSGKIFLALLNTTSLLLGGFTGFYVPLALYYIAQKRHLQLFKKPSNICGSMPSWLLMHWKAVVLFMTFSMVIFSIIQFGVDIFGAIKSMFA